MTLPSAVMPAYPAPSQGGYVRLGGLVAAHHLNGEAGICEQFLEQSRRWVVRLADGSQKTVKSEHLTVIDAHEYLFGSEDGDRGGE